MEKQVSELQMIQKVILTMQYHERTMVTTIIALFLFSVLCLNTDCMLQ